MFTVVFYNVENLFDTENDPNTEDDEFTPEGNKKWDSEKYLKKCYSAPRTTAGLSASQGPERL